MGYVIAALAAVGCAVGLVFRLKVLLPILATLLIASVIFAISHGYGIVDTLLTVIVVQIIVQAGYFLGILIRTYFARSGGMHPIL